MKRSKIKELKLKYPKEIFEDIYLDYSKTKREIAKELGVSDWDLYSLANCYGLKRDSRLQFKGRDKKYLSLAEEYGEEYFKNLFCIQLLGIKEIAEKIGVCKETVNKIIKYYGLKRDRGELMSCIVAKDDSRDKQFQDALNRISKEDIIKYYIDEDHGWEETAEHFNITRSMFDKIKLHYGIKKDFSKRMFKNLDKKYEEYGSKEAYYNQIIEKCFQTRILNAGSIEESYKKGFEKVRETNLKKYGVECILNSPVMESFYKKKNSKPNLDFANLLKSDNLVYSQEFVIGLKSYDFKIDENLIEINPTITHNSTWSPFGNHKGVDRKYHLEKYRLAASNNYRCIHIFDWDDQTKIAKSLLPRVNIYARKCEIKEVGKKEIDSFLTSYHFQNSCRGQKVKLGLYYKDDLIQVMTFGKPRYNNNYEWELLRLCTKVGFRVVGGSEKLFKHFIKNYNPSSIISYCDNSKFKGDVYLRLGMTLKSKGIPTKHWYHMDKKIHISNNLLLRNGFDRLLGDIFGCYGKGTNNESLMIENGFVEVYDCGQSSYMWKKEEI